MADNHSLPPVRIPARPAPAPRRPTSPASSARAGALWLVPVFIALLLLTGLLAGYAVLYSSNRVFPGVSAGGVFIGQSDYDTALARLNSAWATQTLTLRDGDRAWTIPLVEMGVNQNVDAMVRQAYDRGRNWDEPGQIWRALVGNSAVAAVYRPVDLPTARARLERLAADVGRPPVDATIAVANGQAVAVPAQPGRQLDVDATMAAWVAAVPTILSSRALELVFADVPPAVSDVSGLVDQVNSRLARPILLTGYDPVRDERFTWPVSAVVWRDWLQFDVSGSAVNWRADRDAVAAFIQARDAELDPTRYLADADIDRIAAAVRDGTAQVSLRVYHHPSTHLVQAGETLSSIGLTYGVPYPWIQAANPGVDALFAGQSITIPSPDDFLPLPVVENKRVIISLSRQHMWGYENGALVWDQVISTGIDDSPTHPGVFQVQSHEREAYASAWELYMPYFMGIYQPGPNAGVMNGFHGFPTRDGVNLLWTRNLGTPVTYGCVLVDNAIAASFYSWAEEGVVVEIVQ